MKLKMAAEIEKGNILVIDDDPLLTRTLKKILERSGYCVDVAGNGFEGIKKAKSGFFHLVLCDIRMPGLDGLMTIRHIQDFQQRAGAGKSGFIVMTAYDGDDTRHQSCQLGVTEFLIKPFDLPKFLEVMDHHTRPLVKKTPLEEVKILNEKLRRLLSAMDEKVSDDLTRPDRKY
ncbi:MAG: hypothetical protein A3G33_01555 [Omnitrophica bacterium RIFCSPLOWO2_12_FULL_44_17]|uniref:Response regulatory domain-containing protein n=1 Tax=Candidatus Danuiimicrobium aquiferis TaxID=1801832 RepID=A0A1G1KV92_9BACT|nr:MAG: hypothetical protein A3B72_00785 [Omnitrophica bacterium RIFCSPHIGHO2_02_FULL_45_28]OGW96800.1 MAG: hypothetical protein A3G33_01555 [Omnitrophica bacterium RIFCSPLOWO2_12_FULL_44_17]OGX03801.1 MAG: hypothetical protein A3J12_09440 [Omnitrophica bacterium RIFCSPLOWO2_02_FULL_44_11]